MLTLGIIGAVEAAVYLLRYRSAHSTSHWWSAFTGFLIAVTRVVFVAIGASLVLEGTTSDIVLAGGVYAASATITTAALHRHLEKRKKRRAAAWT